MEKNIFRLHCMAAKAIFVFNGGQEEGGIRLNYCLS